MRRLLFCLLSFLNSNLIAQNVKLEISDYFKTLDGKEYATYQFVRSSYSASRSSMIFITTKSVLLSLTEKIPNLFNMKQEFTDVWILGISEFDSAKLSETDNKIISLFYQNIIKYRNDNNLPVYTFKKLEQSVKIILKKEEICNFLSCRTKPWN